MNTPTPWQLNRFGTKEAEHILACINAHDALTARVAELEAALAKLVALINDSDLEWGINHNRATDAISAAEVLLAAEK